jgi:predicted transcriptional regulator
MRNPIPYIKRIDNVELESRYAESQRITYDSGSGSAITYEDIEPFLTKLPDREIDLIELYYKYRKNQKDIARMFGVTQGAVSSRLSRARTRLEFLRDMPKISEEDLDNNLKELFSDLEIEIIKCMIQTTCQSKTASIVNDRFNLLDDKQRMTQVKVRHRFEKCINQLEEISKNNSDMKIYYDLLKYIKKNLYKLHEVKLPHFDRSNSAVFSLNN